MGARRHEHRLRQGRSAVVEGGIGYVHARETGHHGLVFVQQLQGALAGLRLVGRVGGVVLATTDDLPDRRRDVMLVGAGADEVEIMAIGPGALLHQARDGHFRHAGGHVPEFAGAQVRRDLGEQVFDFSGADGLEHLLDVGVRVGDKWHGLALKRVFTAKAPRKH